MLATTPLLAQEPAPAPAPPQQATPPAASAGAELVQPLDAVAAIVDDDVILVSELRAALQRAQVAIAKSGREAPPAQELQRQVFDQLVLESLQLQLAERAGVRITDAELNAAITRIASSESPPRSKNESSVPTRVVSSTLA